MNVDVPGGNSAHAELINFAQLSAGVSEPYDNRSLTTINDHEIRMSVMTAPFKWHLHPDSDETFIVVEGGLIVELEDREVLLRPGELITIPRGVRHCTRPEGARSVNLTVERRASATVFDS